MRSFCASSNYRLAAIFVPINRERSHYEPRALWMNKMTERITDVSIVVKLRAWRLRRDGGLQTSSETFNAAGGHCLRGVPMASHDEGPQPRFDTHEGVVASRCGPYEINNRNSSTLFLLAGQKLSHKYMPTIFSAAASGQALRDRAIRVSHAHAMLTSKCERRTSEL